MLCESRCWRGAIRCLWHSIASSGFTCSDTFRKHYIQHHMLRRRSRTWQKWQPSRGVSEDVEEGKICDIQCRCSEEPAKAEIVARPSLQSVMVRIEAC